MRYDLAIFDFDGTLADTAAWFMAALNQSAARFGFRQLSVEEFTLLRGRGSRDIIRYLEVPFWKIPAIARDMRRRAAADAGKIKLFQGVPEMLRLLRDDGIRIAIVSSNAENTIRSVLGTGHPVEFFECGASLFGKAARFKRVLARAGIPPARAIAIGDEARDIEAARAAGIAAGSVFWGYAAPEFLRAQNPDLAFDSIADLTRSLVPGC